MGFAFQGLSGAAVQLSGNVTASEGWKSSGSVLIQEADSTSRSYTQNTEVDALTYTVPASKIAYITDWVCDGINGTGLGGEAHLYVNGVLVDSIYISGTVLAPTKRNFTTPLKLTAAQTAVIKIRSTQTTASRQAISTILGWTEAA